MQANVDIQLAPEEWPLEPLAIKMKQYCYLLEDLTADVLREQAGGDYELLRKYLRRRAVDAYWQKVLALSPYTHPTSIKQSLRPFTPSPTPYHDPVTCVFSFPPSHSIVQSPPPAPFPPPPFPLLFLLPCPCSLPPPSLCSHRLSPLTPPSPPPAYVHHAVTGLLGDFDRCGNGSQSQGSTQIVSAHTFICA